MAARAATFDVPYLFAGHPFPEAHFITWSHLLTCPLSFLRRYHPHQGCIGPYTTLCRLSRVSHVSRQRLPSVALGASFTARAENFSAIRISVCQHSPMARQNRDTKAILRTIERSEQRSKLFWWMVDQHDEIIGKANGKKIDWPSVCAEAAKRGKLDRSGNPPSVVTAKKTWQRARKEVAAGRATEATQPPRHIYPSRIDKDWRPANAPPPEQPETTGQPPALFGGRQDELIAVRKTSPHERAPFDPKEQKARLRRIINERSGR